jgi:hypothetical protein
MRGLRLLDAEKMSAARTTEVSNPTSTSQHHTLQLRRAVGRRVDRVVQLTHLARHERTKSKKERKNKKNKNKNTSKQALTTLSGFQYVWNAPVVAALMVASISALVVGAKYHGPQETEKQNNEQPMIDGD